MHKTVGLAQCVPFSLLDVFFLLVEVVCVHSSRFYRFVEKTAFLSSPSLPCPLLQGQCLNSFNIYSLSLCVFELLTLAFSVWGLMHEFTRELCRVRPYQSFLRLPGPLPIPHPPPIYLPCTFGLISSHCFLYIFFIHAL